MGALQNARSALFRTLQRTDGAAVTYHRGVSSVGVTAVRGRSQFDSPQDGGFIVQVTSDDWLVNAADLIIGGSVITPQSGDQIRHTVGATVYVYEVMNPPYSTSDLDRGGLRIHSKLIDTI